MRKNITKRNYTKAERIFARALQDNHISFEAHVKIDNMEIDFIVGNYAVEIDGHGQLGSKNEHLMGLGLIPIHFTNQEVYTRDRNKLIKFLL